MATERLAPDALLTQTGLTGSLADIDEDPDTPDASWLTTGSNTDTVCRVSFPTPTGPPTAGVDGQEFRVLLRKTNHSTNPTYTVDLYENGSLVTNLVASTTLSSTAGVVVSAPWNATSLGTADGSLVEVQVTGTVGGGSPGNRAGVEVGAVEWNVTYTATSYKDAAVAFTGSGSGTAAADRVRARAVAFVGGGTVAAAWQRVRARVAAFVGGATFTATAEPTTSYKDAAVSFLASGTASSAAQRVRVRAAGWLGGSALVGAAGRVRVRAVAYQGAATLTAAPEIPGGGGGGYGPAYGACRRNQRHVPTHTFTVGL